MPSPCRITFTSGNVHFSCICRRFVCSLARSGGVTKYKTPVVIGDNNISHQNGRAWSWFMECLLCLEVLWRRPIRLKRAAEINIIFTRIPLASPFYLEILVFIFQICLFFARTWFSGVPAHVSCGITAPLFKDIKFNFIQLSEASSLSFYGLFSLFVLLFFAINAACSTKSAGSVKNTNGWLAWWAFACKYRCCIFF